MKIAHLADAHYGLHYDGPEPDSRFKDIVQTMNAVADRIIEEGCTHVVFAGDFFKDAKMYIDRAAIEILAVADWLRRLSDAGLQVIVISGTPSHDSISAYELLVEWHIPRVHIQTKPAMIPLDGAAFCCLPGMTRGNILTQEEHKGKQPEEIHGLMTEKIDEVTQGMRAMAYDQPIKLLVGHLTYAHADAGFDQLAMQHEPLLSRQAVQGFDLVMLGHIHRPQQVGNVFYSGAPERHRFNDEGVQAGFWIHEWVENAFQSSFIETLAREFLTLKLDEVQVARMVKERHLKWLFDQQPVRGKIVRVQYTCSETLHKQVDRRWLEKTLVDAGAYYVSGTQADVERQERARDQEVTQSLDPLMALERWAQEQSIPAAEITELQALASELLVEVW